MKFGQLFLFALLIIVACAQPSQEDKSTEKSTTTTTTPTSQPASEARIPLRKGKQYDFVEVFDFDEDGKKAYKVIDLPKPTPDPLYFAMDHLTKGTLRRYVRNIRITKIGLNGAKRDIHFKGIPAFEDKAAEKEFLEILHTTAKVYTNDYQFYINDNQFK